MTAFILALSLLLGPTSGHAQDSPPPSPAELTLPPSPPDASPPQPEMPVGVAQPNPDFQPEADHRPEDDAHRAVGGGSGADSTSSTHYKKLKIAKMITGPAIAPSAWKKGHWVHGKHDGSFAWWWVVDQTWFRYDKFTAPYPDHEKRQVYIPNSGSTSLSSVSPGHH